MHAQDVNLIIQYQELQHWELEHRVDVQLGILQRLDEHVL